MQKQKSSNSEELYGELGQAFNFTQGDLEANRAGFMSQRQQEILTTDIAARARMLRIVFTLVFAMNFILFLTPQQPELLGFSVYLLVVAAILCGTYYYIIIRPLNEIKVGMVEKLLSPVTTAQAQNNRGTRYTKLITDNNSFALQGEAEHIVWKGSTYAIYFLPAAKKIMSVEEIQPEQG